MLTRARCRPFQAFAFALLTLCGAAPITAVATVTAPAPAAAAASTPAAPASSAAAAASTRAAHSLNDAAAPAVAPAPNDATSRALQQAVRSAASALTASTAAAKSVLERLYASRTYATLWIDRAAGTRHAHRVLAALAAAPEHGLHADDYDATAIAAVLATIDAGDRSPGAVARADLEVSRALLRYLTDLHEGRVPPARAGFHYPAHAPTFDAAPLVLEAAAGDLSSVVARAEPSFALYGRLRQLLARYRTLAAGPGMDTAAFAGAPKIAVGGAYADAARLRARLRLLGDLADDGMATEPVYDSRLDEAVRGFQQRHGLAVDGRLGKETIAALQQPLAGRVEQIELAMERLRWLPDLGRSPVVAINIPSFRLWALDDASRDDLPAMTMRVVVGRAVTSMQTPVFIGEMRYLEINPFWNVPPSILHNEILPRLQRDPGYLEREDMEIVSGSASLGSTADAAAIAALAQGSARVRQRPGPKNALDGIKFVLPNTMNIYLHGTPAQQLFERTRRDFSHGCIRLEDPLRLATHVLRGQPAWSREGLQAALDAGTPVRADLSSPLPVVLFYSTAIATSNGSAMFLPDVYGYDRKLLAALRAAGRHLAAPPAAEHSAAALKMGP